MKHLYFAPPATEAFLETLDSLWSEGAFSSCLLIGNNDLADDLAAVALKKGISVPRSDALPVASSKKKKKQLLILTEKSGEELSKQLLSCVDLDNVVIVAPITDWHFSQKPLFLVSIPKSGTHLLYELVKAFGYHEGVEAPEFPKGQTWYCPEYTNSHTVARDFFVDTVRRSPFGNRHHSFTHSPTLFMYRHPLDILISEAHYYHKDGKTLFSGWLDGADFDERVAHLLNDNWLVGSLRERIGGFLPWLSIPNVIPLSFEELIGAAGGGNNVDQLKLIWSIQLKLQVPGDPKEISSRIFNPDSATFRSGQIGAYKKHLPEDIVSDFLSQNKDILITLGYSLDGSVTLPVNRESHRNRRIRFSSVNYENTSVLIESDFMGFNLVRYSGRIYAVPTSTGKVQLEKLSEKKRAVIISALSVSEVRARVAEREIREQKINYENIPLVIERDFMGCNLVRYSGRIYAVPISAGKVQLEKLSEKKRAVIISASSASEIKQLLQLRDDIDGFSVSLSKDVLAEREIREQEIGALAEKQTKLSKNVLAEREIRGQEIGALAEKQTKLSEDIAQLQKQILDQQSQIRALESSWAVRYAKNIKHILGIK